MSTETQKSKQSASVRIYTEKANRIKKVKRAVSAAENRDLSDTGLLDEILEEGLSKREKKLGIK